MIGSRLVSILLGLTLSLSAWSAMAQGRADVVVRAPAATYVGAATNTGRRFLGIRYAQAPIGELRWAAPRPIAQAPRTRIDARAFGARCVQPADPWQFNPQPGEAMEGQEDCLFLNVYAPKRAAVPLAVMVWVHGGGFVTGAGSDYDAHLLAESQDVIVVTINYRLGALGFLAHPALGEEGGGFGLLDQQAALRWVKRNIGAFGGDPERVTLFGESAGGVSTCAQLRAPGAAGLFSRAIIESGPCVAFPRKAADAKGLTYAREARCAERGAAALACLRRLPARVAGSTPATTAVGLGDTPWTLVDGTATLPDVASSFAVGRFNRVPVLNGTNRDEGRAFALASMAGLATEAAYLKNLETQYGARAAAVAAKYPIAQHPSVALAYSAYMTDWLFACPALATSRSLAAHVPVYAYEFRDRAAPSSVTMPEALGSLGAYHGAEIQYVFGLRTPFSGPATFDPEQRALSDRMQAAWASFARDGVPTLPGASRWVPVTSADAPVRSLDVADDGYVRDFAEQHRCAFWSEAG